MKKAKWISILHSILLPAGEFPFWPMCRLKFVLKQIVFICKIGIWMNISRVPAEYEHWWTRNNSWMMISWSWWQSSCKSPTPWLIFHIESNQIVQHAFPIVTTKHVNCIFVRYCCVLASPANAYKTNFKIIYHGIYLCDSFNNTLPRQKCHTQAFSSIVEWFRMA